MPMPRLTYQPSGMSCAARAAMASRDHGLQAAKVFATALACTFTLASSRHRRFAIGHVHDAIDENPGGTDFLRVERAKLNNVLRLGDGQLRRHRHHRIEI